MLGTLQLKFSVRLYVRINVISRNITSTNMRPWAAKLFEVINNIYIKEKFKKWNHRLTNRVSYGADVLWS